MDAVFDTLATFLDETNATCVAMAQGGDVIGGLDLWRNKPLLRKVMNSFVIRRDRQFPFLGRMNDDVNTYLIHGIRGQLFWTVMKAQLVQVPTQQQSGGITELYKAFGTYVKSFYSVMMAPSCVRIVTMGPTNPRMHHQIRQDNAYPKIINEKYRKPRPTTA